MVCAMPRRISSSVSVDREIQRVDAPGKPLQADQGHGVFAASTRTLCGDQHVHLRELAVAHPVHECDFGAIVVEVAERVGTIEKNADGGILSGASAILCGEG